MRTLTLLLGMAGAVVAQERKPHPGVDPAKVDAAIDRGVKWLLSPANTPFVISLNSRILRLDELQLYTLLHAGADRDGQRFQDMLRNILTTELEKTYCVSLQAMCLLAMDPVKYRDRLAQCAQFLVDNQCENGQWDYGEATKMPPEFTAGDPGYGPARKGEPARKGILIRRQRKGAAAGDNSNSQYAALGLRACLEAAVFPPRETLELAKKWWEGAQNGDGGWGYLGRGGVSYGSMTAGAVGGLAIYTHYLGGKWVGSVPVIQGFKWMGKNFSVKENPLHPTGPEYYYYYLYSVERAGMLTDAGKMGGHDWYREGANHLLAIQQESGTWTDKAMGGAVHGTCFAILFLRRATVPLPKVATGPAK